MAWTTEQLEALEEAIATGALEVKYQDRTIKYQSLEAMLSLRNRMQTALEVVGTSSRRYFQTSKGLCG